MQSINSNDNDVDLVESKIQVQTKKDCDILEIHERYVLELKTEANFNKSEEEEWISEIKKPSWK